MEQLRKEFERTDSRREGKCDPSHFKKVLSKFGVTTGVNNVVKRFSNEGLVNYNDFLGYFEQSRSKRPSSVPSNTVIEQPPQKPKKVVDSPIVEKPIPSQKPRKMDSVETKLYTFRTAIEKDLKQIDKENKGTVGVDSFKKVLGKCFDNQDVIKSIVGSISSGNNGKLFLDLLF